MASHIVVLSEAAIDIRLTKKCARRITSDEICCETNPAIKALPEIEREMWILHCNGIQGREIALMLGLRKDVVSRALAAIRAKLQYLVAFRNILEDYPELKAKFYALSK